jgi:hypothetical protein
MTFEGIETRNLLAAHAKNGAQDRPLLVGAPLLLAGWLALCIWCVLSLGGLATLSAAPTALTGRAARPDTGLVFASTGMGECPCPRGR